MKTSAWWVAALLVAGGCKDEVASGITDGDADSDSDGDSDSDADADADADSDSVPVRVYTQDRRGARQPAPGALVAFDLPSGARVEQTADGDGRTTFANVDWSSGGTAAVIAHLDGWQLGGITAMTEPYVAGILEATGELMVVLGVNPESRDGLVEVSGSASMVDSGNLLTVVATVPGRTYEGFSPEWSVLVTPDVPFTLVAIESANSWSGAVFHQPLTLTVVDHDGVTEPSTIDVDTTRPNEPSRFSGWLEQPGDTIGRATFFRDATPYVTLASLESYGLFSFTFAPMSTAGFGFVGLVSTVDGTSAPTWNFEGEYVPVRAVVEPATAYFWFRNADWWRAEWCSRVVVSGLPGNGSPDVVFPEPPMLVSGAATEAYQLGELLSWDLAERDAAAPTLEVVLALIAEDRRNALATVFAPAGTRSARIPRPPSDVDTSALLGEIAQGRLELCELDPSRSVCLRYAMGGLFDVVP